jgi:hypothetical protein
MHFLSQNLQFFCLPSINLTSAHAAATSTASTSTSLNATKQNASKCDLKCNVMTSDFFISPSFCFCSARVLELNDRLKNNYYWVGQPSYIVLKTVIGVPNISPHGLTAQLRFEFGGHDSSVGTATRYRLNSPGTECQWGRNLPCCPHWSQGQPSVSHNTYRVFPGVKRPKRGAEHPPPYM